MAELEKAKLQEVKADETQSTIGDPLPVQFNPASLRLKLTNQSSGNRTRGRQVSQNNGQSSTVLSMDLVFDSADEGTDGAPVSVREKTNLVERFVLPKENSSDAPPLLRFEWDKLIIIGIVESIDINFEHFAANGAPLRAKMSLSIKEQEPKYAYLKLGKGKKNSDGSQPSGSAGNNTPGNGTNDPGSNTPNSDRSDTALDGETAPEFLARKGLNPAAWRGLDVDLSAGLSLEAGIEVGFSAGIGVGIGIGVGVSAGVMAEVGVSLEASLGIGASAVLSAGAGASSNASVSAGLSAGSGNAAKSGSSQSKKIDGNGAGMALSAAGGVQSAIETVKINETRAVTNEAQSAFGIQAGGASAAGANLAAAGSAGAALTAAKVSYSPLATSQQAGVDGKLPDAGASKISVSATTPPKADPRSTSYGYGVPLQPLYAVALSQEQVRLCPRNETGLRDDNGPRFRKQKTTSPWVALPQRDKTRARADQAESKRGRQKRKCNPGSF